MLRRHSPYLGWCLAVALLGPVLGACGGGGGTTSTPATPAVLDLGTLESTIANRTVVSFPNPLRAEARVTSGGQDGPFWIDPADLPAQVQPGATVALGVQYEPLGEGPVSGTVTLVYAGSGGPVSRTYELRASGESVTWNLLTPSLDFGALFVGEALELDAQVVNLSVLSPVTLTNATLPGPEFEVVGDPFPMVVDPGYTATVRLRYAPTAAGVDNGTLVLGPTDPGARVAIPVLAQTVDGSLETLVDFGTLSLDSNGRTPTLSVTVPADAISLYIEGYLPSTFFTTNMIGLNSLTGPGGTVYENPQSTGSYIWSPGIDVFSTCVPNTDRSNVQLVPGGGTYLFSLRRLQGTGTSMAVRAIVERRPANLVGTATLDLNVWLASGVAPTAATAPNDARLQQVLTRIDGILALQGIRVGDVDYYDVTNSAYDEVTTNAELSDLLQTTSSASQVRVNLFFVNVVFGGGVVGVSATICGPKRNGTVASGVLSIYDGYSTSTIGLIAAHEIGHFLGLYHTVEQDGSHDFIDDTLNCPSSGTDSVCTVPGGGYLMHWQALGGTTITDGQGLVLRAHPHLDPGTQAPLRVAKPTVDGADLLELLSLPDNWCGTCAQGGGPGKAD